MISSDPFSQPYAGLLAGTYDVVGRFVLNAMRLSRTPV